MNYIILNLDTTPPNLEIHAPNYTTRTSNTIISIESNEELSTYQEIYILDSEGVNHELTFSMVDNELLGNVYLHGFPTGIATLYVRLKDRVDNVSQLYSHSFYIMESEILTSELLIEYMNHTITTQSMFNDSIIDLMNNESSLTIMSNKKNISSMKNEMAVIV